MFLDTHTQSITRNWFDPSNRKYYYKIVQEILKRRIGQGHWIPFDRQINVWPGGGSKQGTIAPVIKVAADNNRVLIQTEDNNLYWRCLIGDAASWVLTAIDLAEYVGIADEAIFQFIADNFPDLVHDRNEIQGLIWKAVDSYAPDIKTLEDQTYNSLESWARAYKDWVVCRHNPDLGWNTLLDRKWSLDNQSIDSKQFFEHHRILDIAVGNWNGTVITYYVLTESADNPGAHKIWFIDEEPIMGAWAEIPLQDDLELPSQGYHMLCASNSVVAVASYGNNQPVSIQWIRCDAHSNDQFPVWPMNWTEAWSEETPIPPEILSDQFSGSAPYDMGDHNELVQQFPPLDVYNKANYPGWHKVRAPAKTLSEFKIDVGYGIRPWPVPHPHVSALMPPFFDQLYSPVWKIYWVIYAISIARSVIEGRPITEVGCLGVNPISPNSNYPVCCIIRADAGQYMGFAINKATDDAQVQWLDIDEDSTTSSILCEQVNEDGEPVGSGDAFCRTEAGRRRRECQSFRCPNAPLWVRPVCEAAAYLCLAAVLLWERLVCPFLNTLGIDPTLGTENTNRCKRCWRGPSEPNDPNEKKARLFIKAQRVIHFIFAVFLHKRVSSQIAAHRISICMECEFVEAKRCSLCGCRINTYLPSINLASYVENLPWWGCKHPGRDKGKGWPYGPTQV